MQRKSFIFNSDKTMCTGCGACTQICSRHALSMMPDKEGFLFPVMDPDKCINCGVCDRICPVVNDRSNQNRNQKGYLATTVEEKYFKNSASIGICTMLSEYVLKQNGVVFGSFLDEDSWQAYHIDIGCERDVEKIRNSKYLQSDTRQTFSIVKQLLVKNKERDILYIGTPCQIAGLKAFLNKDFPNLYTVDLICNGVFSPKLMPLEVKYWEDLFGARLCNFRFRSKRKYKQTNEGMVNFDLCINGKLKHIERHASSSPSYRAYAYSGDGNNYNLRLSCYTCRFRSSSRYGDITIGDPWSINNSIVINKSLDGHSIIRSLFSVNTEKGRQLMDCINNHLIVEEHSITDLFLQPALLQQSRQFGRVREELYSRLDNEEYGNIVEDLLKCKLEQSHRSFVRYYYIGLIKRKIKAMIGL